MPSVKYSNYLEINPAFESVVDIDADKRNRDLWREYIVGDDMDTLMEYLCESLGNEAPDLRRSFWIHGSYGTGKSYAAIFVKHMIEEKPEIIDDYLAKSGRLSRYRNRFAKCRKNGDYLVVWKTGCTGIRSGDMMLLEMEKAISDALREKFGDAAYLGSGSLMSAVNAKLNDPSINWDYLLETTVLSDDYGTVDELRQKVAAGDMTAMQTTAMVIRQKGYGLVNNLETFKEWVGDVIDGNELSKSGIFFIWDEFTEYVAHSDDHTVMQQISEFCKEKPIFMLYVVHRSQEMVDSMGKDRYQMITNRFHQTEFHVSADAAFDLIAGSILPRTGAAEHWKEARSQVTKRIKPFMPNIAGLDDQISEKLDLYCPMHPMTIRLLSRVAESFAAAQRTMFRFMKDQSDTELGFVGYINKYGPDDQACWLTPDWLWDYFFTRESDYSDKDTKAAEYILHYEEKKHLVESDENAFRIFKIAMLLLAVMSSTKGLGGLRSRGGIAATVECLENCLAGVVSKEQVTDLLDTMEESKILLRDKAANGDVRLQLPFRGSNADDLKVRLEVNDKKYTRYQLFSKDGAFAQSFEERAWDDNDAAKKRMKICVCCAETNSINFRLDEVRKELDKYPYKLGLLIVTVRDEAQYMSIQNDLAKRAADSDEPRLTIALVKTPLTDERRTKWLDRITRQEMATATGSTASARQYEQEAASIKIEWILEAINGSKIIAWNGSQVFSNQYGMANLRKTIQTKVLQVVFPYAPETIVVTNTAYKPCNDGAPLAGILRESNNAQLKNVLNALQVAGLLDKKTIGEIVEASGSKAAESISELARTIRTEMESGQRVMLGDLWMNLQKGPFGYYNTIACGVLLGYVFSCYKDSAFSWTDNAQSTHVLGETTLKTMILSMCKGTMTTDYLSAGSVTFQNFRQYAQRIMALSDAQIANETECWHNMREAVTKAGAPFWVLKYLPDEMYGSVEFKHAAEQIVDNIQQFIALDNDRDSYMSNVIELFNGRGKLRKALEKAFQDKATMSIAFRAFLFSASPELKQIAEKLHIPPEELSDKLHMVMQNAIYTWTEEQVKEKLADVVGEYKYLDALNNTLGKAYHSLEDVKKELANLFRFMRVPLSAIEKLGPPWTGALQVLFKLSRSRTSSMSQEERDADTAALYENGKAAMDCLRDCKPVLTDIIEHEGIECTVDELGAVYAGLKDMECDASLAQFERELKSLLGRISQSRNREQLKATWRILTGQDSVKSWCALHGVPILWVVGKENTKAFETLIDVQNDSKALDVHVQNAIQLLTSMDHTLLADDKRIFDAFIDTVGSEYRPVLEESREDVLIQAKMKIGNDMSSWGIADLVTFQRILKKIQQDKAKKEKLSNAKNVVESMNDVKLRERVTAFLDAHPEFCDDFTE
mgnify:CR=1 FL=1